MKLRMLINEDLVGHAKRELELAGLFDKDSDYDGMLGDAALGIIKTFASQGHSGYSAGIVSDIVNKLMRYETLTKNDHEEYNDVSECSGLPEGSMFQDKRNPSWFSNDGGKSWYNVNELKSESKNVMLDKDFETGLYRFAKGKWDSSTPAERHNFLVSAGIDSVMLATDIKSEFDNLNQNLKKQIIFNITKDDKHEVVDKFHRDLKAALGQD